MKLKYRVSYPCYHYNTGNADNGSYMHKVDFDDLNDAKIYKHDVDYQYGLYNESSPNKVSHMQLKDIKNVWENSDSFIDIEDGYIDGKAKISKLIEEVELELDENLFIYVAEDSDGIIGICYGDFDDFQDDLFKDGYTNFEIKRRKLKIL